MTSKFSLKRVGFGLFFLFVAMLASAQESIPVIGYMGVPQNSTSDESYRVMRECGFDVNLASFSSVTAVRQALDCAERNGMRIIVNCAALRTNPSLTRQVKNHPALYGYFIEDEPSAERMRELAPTIARLKAADPQHPCYMNLLPWYNKGQLRTFKTASYEEYVETYVETGMTFISFDIYPIQNSGLRPSWFENLEKIRRSALRSGLPFWAFVLATPHRDYPQPRLEHLRLQVYANLAYGAQAIQYFTYWTPKSDRFDYHNGPVDTDGRKTKTYDLVRQMNDELRTVGQLFLGAKVTAVGHLGTTLPEGCTKATAPLNIQRIALTKGEGAIVSQFTKGGRHYAAIVNRSYKKKATLRLTPKNTTPRRLTKRLTPEALNTSYTLAPGDILLLQLD